MLTKQSMMLLPAAMLVMVLTLVAGTASAQTDTAKGFETNQLASYIEAANRYKPTQVMMGKVPGMNGKFVMGLKDVRDVRLLPMPVEPNTKYSLKMRARYDGSESIEENPYFAMFHRYDQRTQLVPERKITFYDAQNQRLSDMSTGMAMRNWHDYNDVFYTPENAASIVVSLGSGIEEITCFIDGVSLSKAPDEGAININPVYSKLGVYNYSGWSRLGPGAKMVEIDGKAYFDPQYGSSSQPMPLSEPGNYILKTVTISNGYSPAIMLNMRDANGKSTGQVRVGGGVVNREFVLPPGTSTASFQIRSVLIEELRVVRNTSKP